MKKEHNVVLSREDWEKVVECIDDTILDYMGAKHPKAKEILTTLAHIQGNVTGQLKGQGLHIE